MNVVAANHGENDFCKKKLKLQYNHNYSSVRELRALCMASLLRTEGTFLKHQLGSRNLKL